MRWNPFGSSESFSDWIANALAGSMVIIALGTLGAGIFYWAESPGDSGVNYLITSLGAFGTLILAAATFVSVRQSTRSVSELEKERQKPIVKDEIVKVIQPAIDALSANVKRAEQEQGIDFVLYDQPIYNANSSTDRISSVFADPAPVAMVRLHETRPDLWSRLEDHQEYITRMIGIGNGLPEKMETPIRVCAEELGWEKPEEELDIRLLMHSVVKDTDEYGENSDYYTFWQEHREEIKDLVRALADDEMKELESLKPQWKELCEDLSEDLLEYKVELQQDFGISESAVDEELEEWRGVI